MADTKDTAQQQPKFEWDYDVPDTPFWRDLPFTAGRNFLTCYNSSELEDINFDGTLSVPAKFAFLLSLLEARLATRKAAVAPVLLHLADYPEWSRLMLGIQTMQKYLDAPEQADTLRIMLETSEGDRRVPWLNMLAEFKLKHGEYAEAERLEREVLPWMQKHEKLGIDSPQALGTTRRIIEALWRQGGSKVDEARRLADETAELVEAMGPSKFVKYQEEERQMLRDLVAELEKS